MQISCKIKLYYKTCRYDIFCFNLNLKLNGLFDNVDVNKILVYRKESYGEKGSLRYFIGYNENDDIRPLCIKLPQMIGYAKCFESNNKIMSFKIIDKKLLKK